MMLFRRPSLARVFSVKQSWVKQSDTATYLQQKRKFKSYRLLVVLEQIFLCSFTQGAAFYWSIDIKSLQSLLKWSNCLPPLN